MRAAVLWECPSSGLQTLPRNTALVGGVPTCFLGGALPIASKPRVPPAAPHTGGPWCGRSCLVCPRQELGECGVRELAVRRACTRGAALAGSLKLVQASIPANWWQGVTLARLGYAYDTPISQILMEQLQRLPLS